jgi:uncharacterized protein YbjQ (UPF0145 family)
MHPEDRGPWRAQGHRDARRADPGIRAGALGCARRGGDTATAACRSGRRRGRPRNHGERRMIISTTDGIEGRRIAGYLGVVSGDAVMGTNVFRDMFAGLRDIVGGRSGAYEKELKQAKRLALDEMVEEATELGADAIVGVDLDYEHLGNEGRSMLMVSANGTAVKLT